MTTLDTRPEPPEIHSDFDARWYLERIFAAEEELDRAVAYQQQVTDAVAKRVAAMLNAVNNAKMELHLAMAKANVRNVKCPDLGTAYFQTRAPKVIVKDEKSLIDDERFTVETVKVSQSRVSAHFNATGELPPGCELEDARATLCIKKATPKGENLFDGMFDGGNHE